MAFSYGARSKHVSHGSLMMIVKGAHCMIVKRKLPYAIKKEPMKKASRWGCILLASARSGELCAKLGRWCSDRKSRIALKGRQT